jgi:leucyl-tRNA synthetase
MPRRLCRPIVVLLVDVHGSPQNTAAFCDRKLSDWTRCGYYIGGTEHAVGYLLYVARGQKYCFDLGQWWIYYLRNW